MPLTPIARIARIALSSILLAPLALVAGCASGGATGPVSGDSRPAPRADEAPAEAPPPAGAIDAAKYDAGRLVSVARLHARAGMIDVAVDEWDRAIAELEPYTSNAEVARILGAIEDEKRHTVGRGEERLAAVDVPAVSADPESKLLAEIISGPEPEVDLEQVDEVEEGFKTVEPDYPVVRNDRVLAWVEAYSGRLKGFFGGSLARSGRYTERFREIFAEEGIPQDLINLAHVESGFKVSAYSRAHAKGIFQFISSTGRRYGLRTDWWVDERSDPEKACRASAAYLRDLYHEFGDWKLALAAYNGGEGRVRRAIRTAGSKDFWVLSDKKLLRRETRNYVPAILAATLIAKQPEKFGFTDVRYEAPELFEYVVVPTPTDLDVVARVIGADPKAVSRLNPALRRGQTPPKQNDYVLRVPAGTADGFAEKIAQVPMSERVVKTLHRVARGDTLYGLARRYGTTVRAIQDSNTMGRRTLLSVGQVLEIPRAPVSGGYYSGGSAVASSGTWYTVRRGDTLSRIALRFGVSVRNIQAWNGMGRSTRIIAGNRLRVRPEMERSGSTKVAAGSGRHTVRSGDTLWDISRRYGVSLDALMAVNGLSKRSTLRPGQTLRLPGAATAPSAASTTTAKDRVHVVRKGESLVRIAKSYGTTIERICRLNGIDRWTTIYPGDRLRID